MHRDLDSATLICPQPETHAALQLQVRIQNISESLVLLPDCFFLLYFIACARYLEIHIMINICYCFIAA